MSSIVKAAAIPPPVPAVPSHPLHLPRQLAAGLALCGALAAAATALGKVAWLQSNGFSALTLAIVLGIVVGNTAYPRMATGTAAGVEFSKQRLLRLGVMLYGLRLTVHDIAQVGLAGILIDLLVLGSTFVLGAFAGMRWFKLDRQTSMLIGAGSAICGAAAVMATAPVLKARAEQVMVAVATVVVFGTVTIFLYPVLFGLAQDWGLIPGGAAGFGVYAGSTIHEVAQVVAAAQAIGPEAADTAVIAKMVRVLMLAPFLIALSAGLARRDAAAGQAAGSGVTIPWFAVGFVGVVLFNSLDCLPAPARAWLNSLDTVLLAMAMAALGLATRLSAIRKAGLKPLLLAALLFGWLVGGGALINHGVSVWLG